MSVEPGDRVRYSEEFLHSLRSSRPEEELRARRGRCLDIRQANGRRVALVEWEGGGQTRAPASYFSRP